MAGGFGLTDGPVWDLRGFVYVIDEEAEHRVRQSYPAGCTGKIDMAIRGHKTPSVFDRYNIVSQSGLKKFAAKLGLHGAEDRSHSKGGNAKVGTPRPQSG